MPMPRIHQVARKPFIGGQPMRFPGEITGAFDWHSVALAGTGAVTGNNTTDTLHGIANTWTVMFWYKPNSATQTTSEALFHLKAVGDTNNEIVIQILGATANDPMNAIIKDSAGNTIKDYSWDSQTTSITVTGMYVVTWDGTNLLFYRDTTAVTPTTLTTDTTGTMTDTARAVGLYSLITAARYHNGVHNCVAVWNTALSATEIKSLWLCGMGDNANLNVAFDEYASQNSLVHWWRPGLEIGTTTTQLGKDYATGTSARQMNGLSSGTIGNNQLAVASSNIPRTPQPAHLDLTTNETLRNTTAQTLGVSNVMTWAMWYRWDAANNTLAALFDMGASANNNNRIFVTLDENNTTDELDITIYDSSGVIIKNYTWPRFGHPTNGAVQLGSTLMVFTWDGPNNVLKAYRNGVQLTGETRTNDVNSSARTDTNVSINIGCNKAAGNVLTANVHYLACWDKILTPCEIRMLWSEGHPVLDLSKNTLGYYGADNLKHWWRFTRPPGTIYNAGTAVTTDYVKTGGINVETNAANISTADMILSSGTMPMGALLNFDGTQWMTAPAQTWGIANNWTIQFCSRPGSLTGNQTVFQIGENASANTIRVDFVDAVTDYFDVYIYDSAGSIIKNYRYNTPISTSVFRIHSWTWDGTTLTYYRSGSATAANTQTVNNSGTMTDTSRALYVGALPDGAQPLNSRMVHLAVWNSVHTANEVQTLHKGAVANLFDYRRNMGSYVSAANLKHWWKFGADPHEWGKDFIGSITLTGNAALYTQTLHAHQNMSEMSN